MPAPNAVNGVTPALQTNPRNSIAFDLATPCTTASGAGGTTVSSLRKTVDYVPSAVPFKTLGCMAADVNETAPGPLNHVEVDISPSGIVIYGTDAGTAGPLVALASADFTMPLTRGLIWIEDQHYNACKFDTQCDHTYAWDNIGFDGPVLPRDLSFDVSDHAATQTFNGQPAMELGYYAKPKTLSTIPVSDVNDASAALLTLNWFPTARDKITYSLNDNPPRTQAWPFPGSGAYVWRTIALPVDLSQVVNGVNTVTISISDGAAFANVDQKLVGAGGVPTCLDPSNCPTSSPSSSSPPASAASAPAASYQLPSITAAGARLPSSLSRPVIPTGSPNSGRSLRRRVTPRVAPPSPARKPATGA